MTKFVITVAIAFALLWGQRACAASLAEPAALQQTIEMSDVVVVAQLVEHVPSRFFPGKESATFFNEKTGGIIWESIEGRGVVARTKPLPLGMYTFQVIDLLKGEVKATFSVPLFHVSSEEYGYVVLRVEKGDKVLLFLRKKPDGELFAADPAVPLAWLNKEVPKKPFAANGAVKGYVVDRLSESLGNSLFRRANTFLLRTVKGKELSAELSRYSDDPNPDTRSNVLYGLAINQQVEVIAKIAQLQNELARSGGGTDAVEGLAHYSSPSALSHLHKLLFDPDYSVRLNGIGSIRRLANKTSIPYLILALNDPDPQKVVRFTAYITLHRLIPGLGKPLGWVDFNADVEKNIRPLKKWWDDDLMGRHVKKDVPVSAREVPTEPSAKLAYLQSQLFDPSSHVRRNAIASFGKMVDFSSIPYLLLTVNDPDLEIAYQSYVLLAMLVDSQQNVESAEVFAAQKDTILTPYRKWWKEELLGKHRRVSKEKIR